MDLSDTFIQKTSTGFIDLDKILDGGLQPSSLIFFGARNCMGKTSLLLTLTYNLAQQQQAYAYYTFGESKKHILKKLVSIFSEVEINKFVLPLQALQEHQELAVTDKRDAVNGLEFQRIIAALNELDKDEKSFIEDTIHTPKDLLDSMEIAVKNGIKFFFIDYIQQLTRMGVGDVYQESSKIINELKIFANTHNVCLIVASQLSRKVEERQGHRPMMTDYRDTGAIEDTADIIISLLRKDYYDPSDKPGMAYLFVQKNRYGSIGAVSLTFRREICQFANWTPIKYGYLED